jgi:hypothetical protein
LGSDDGVASFEFVLSGFKVAVFVTSLEAWIRIGFSGSSGIGISSFVNFILENELSVLFSFLLLS